MALVQEDRVSPPKGRPVRKISKRKQSPLNLARRGALPIGLYVILGVLIVLPILLVILSAFTTSPPRPGNIDLTGLTFENFRTVFGPGAGQAALNSLFVGVGSSVLAIAI
ncbi:MAG TPA: hypothetical protein H9830_06885, partial [Candidatus Agrococcus pullicola]|nr:hypothetical protein [Candidatus Agrococcus pullicola]